MEYIRTKYTKLLRPGALNGAFLTGRTWKVPEDAEKPERFNKKKEQLNYNKVHLKVSI